MSPVWLRITNKTIIEVKCLGEDPRRRFRNKELKLRNKERAGSGMRKVVKAL